MAVLSLAITATGCAANDVIGSGEPPDADEVRTAIEESLASFGPVVAAETDCVAGALDDDTASALVAGLTTADAQREFSRALTGCAPQALVDLSAEQIVAQGVITDPAAATCIARETLAFVGADPAVFDEANASGTGLIARDLSVANRERYEAAMTSACAIDPALLRRALDESLTTPASSTPSSTPTTA
jgi:hypothetical protein